MIFCKYLKLKENYHSKKGYRDHIWVFSCAAATSMVYVIHSIVCRYAIILKPMPFVGYWISKYGLHTYVSYICYFTVFRSRNSLKSMKDKVEINTFEEEFSKAFPYPQNLQVTIRENKFTISEIWPSRQKMHYSSVVK